MTAFIKPAGRNFHLAEPVPARALWESLTRVARFIQDIEPYGSTLNRYSDWWEHDGLHFPAGTLDNHMLFGLLASPRSILEAMPGDDYVFIGIAPADGRWYLRFYLDWDARGIECVGRFDMTVPHELAARFQHEIADHLPAPMIAMDADAYYRSIQC
ncbi:MAG TPA: hypothetical protein VD886_16740 [Herpetosiphonaceae bacterium]|nr:hypothetical protein [Herpetosiphonaceae bacterium]